MFGAASGFGAAAAPVATNPFGAPAAAPAFGQVPPRERERVLY